MEADTGVRQRQVVVLVHPLQGMIVFPWVLRVLASL